MAKAATADIPADSTDKKGKKKKKMGKTKRNIALGVLALFALIIWYGFQPLYGTIHVGICRTYAELQLRYPSTMKLTMMDQYQDAIRLYYTFTGPFGESRSSLIECTFAADPATGQIVASAIKIDQMEATEKQLAAFNATIPVIIESEPSLIIPPPFSGDLNDLKR